MSASNLFCDKHVFTYIFYFYYEQGGFCTLSMYVSTVSQVMSLTFNYTVFKNSNNDIVIVITYVLHIIRRKEELKCACMLICMHILMCMGRLNEPCTYVSGLSNTMNSWSCT